MNTRQKISLGILAPLFGYAVGHTILNKISMNSPTQADKEVIEDTLKTISDSETSEFKAKILMNIIEKSANNEKELINNGLNDIKIKSDSLSNGFIK